MRLRLYLARTMLLSIVGAGAVLMILALGLDLIDTATDLLDLGGWTALGTYALYRLPLIAVTVVPIAVLTGGAIGFFALAARSELVVMRAAGLNTLRLLLMLAPVSVLLGIGYGVLSDRIAASAERGLVAGFPELLARGEGGLVWARAPGEIVRIRASDAAGTRLEGVTIFTLGAQGQMLSRTDADAARHDGAGWRLEGRITRRGAGAGVTEAGAVRGPVPRAWTTRLSPADVVTLDAKPEFVGAGNASAVLAGIAYGARGASFYETRLWRGFAAGLVPAIMLVFAASAGFGLTRSGGRAWLSAAGIATGFLFIATDGFLISLGTTGAMDPRLAVFTAPVLFAALGLWGIVLLEE